MLTYHSVTDSVQSIDENLSVLFSVLFCDSVTVQSQCSSRSGSTARLPMVKDRQEKADNFQGATAERVKPWLR